ncbi:MAG TPA: flagellar hook-basal body complex protein FliE [Rhodoblastus sp.]|nr:flagellar hook-basal body complex protein FliE [Rhodoblastus sp.]
MIPISLGSSVANGVMRAIGGAAPQPASGSASDFGSMLARAVSSAPRSIADAEDMASAAIHGKAPTREVVERLIYAEQNLQVALAIRDKAVVALQEITRMAI